MSRVKNGRAHHRRVKKVLKQAKGYQGRRSKLYRSAKEAVMRSLMYAYIGRKRKKRDFRKLWVIRINAAVRNYGINYSQFINGLKKIDIQLNRKILSQLAIEDKKGFQVIVKRVKEELGILKRQDNS